MSVLHGLPCHVINFIARPHIILRLPVTIETPLHVKRIYLPGDRHLIDASVAGGTTNAFGNMDAVIEVNEVGQIVDPIPFQRRACRKTSAHGREHLCIGKDLRMTRHARFSGGQSGKGRFFHRRVAVAAIDAIVAHMMFVAERHRLVEWNIDIRRVGRPIDRRSRPASAADKND